MNRIIIAMMMATMLFVNAKGQTANPSFEQRIVELEDRAERTMVHKEPLR